MPTVRIRTLDPDAVSFFTSKLADCGFDVEFAAPGQRVRGEVDLEITVNHTRKPPATRKDTRNSASHNRPPAAQNRPEWTTPYHAEAPDLANEFMGGPVGGNDSKDRDLARILAAGPRRGDMFVIGIQEPEVAQVSPTITEPKPEPLPIPKPVAVNRPLETSSRPKSKQATNRSWAVHRQSFLQRYAAFAAAIILPVAIIIFYLSVLGTPDYAAERSTPQTPLQTRLNASPVNQPSQVLVPEGDTAATRAPGQLVPSASPENVDSIDSQTSTGNLTPTRPRQVRGRNVSAQNEEPEVVVRHFSSTSNKATPNNQ